MVDIREEQSGQRVDNFLLTRLKGVPRSHVYRLLRTGQVRVNKKRIKPTYRLQTGDMVRLPPVRTAQRQASGAPGKRMLQSLEHATLYEDPELLILNKPSGMAVHGGSGVSFGVIEGLRALRPDAPYLELVHRLDRDTSGCLMIAKKRSELRRLHRLLRQGDSDKRYLALLKGHWQGGRRGVDAPLFKNVLHSGDRLVRVSENGKASLSIFAPLEIFANASLMEIILKTGRTHQIRVHASHIEHPVAGDLKYGSDEFNRQMQAQGLKRLFLHAASLEFVVPDTNKRVRVKAPLGKSLETVLKKLRLPRP